MYLVHELIFYLYLMNIQACIFDLDGVIVDTAKYHYRAWRRLANSLGFDFTETDNEQLKGVSRMQSLDIILNIGKKTLDESSKQALASQKNDWYLEYITAMTPDEILPGIPNFLDDLDSQNIRIALGSASKNAVLTLEKVKLLDRFDIIIDGTKTTRSKPDPQVFLMGAVGLDIPPKNCIVFEDAVKGVEAARKAGMYAVGVGTSNFTQAHAVIPSFEKINFEGIKALLKSVII